MRVYMHRHLAEASTIETVLQLQEVVVYLAHFNMEISTMNVHRRLQTHQSWDPLRLPRCRPHNPLRRAHVPIGSQSSVS